MKSQILIHGKLLNDVQSAVLRMCVEDEMEDNDNRGGAFYQVLTEIKALLDEED